MKISLPDDLEEFVRRKVESGQYPSEDAVLQEALNRFRRDERAEGTGSEKATLDDLTDFEAIEACAREVEGEAVPSLEEVREALSKIPGSMAEAVIEEREDRF